MEQKQNRIKDIKDVVRIIRRRRWGLILPALAVLLLSVLLVLVLKPVYRSTSTILIEEQEVPPEYVMTTLTSYAEERLNAINERIMSTSNLLDIINRFNLYADKRDKWTTEEMINQMRKKDIKFKTVTADVINHRTGTPTEATIAFTVSFQGENPRTAQQVANELASLYLEENMKMVDQKTQGITQFLDQEMQSVQSRLVGLDKEIAVYKGKNPRSLPELLQFNLQALDWNERNESELKDQLRSLQDKESYLKTQLAAVAPDSMDQDKEQLKELRAALINLKTMYSDRYPDVIKAKAAITELENKIKSRGGKPVGGKPDNPSYIALAAELASVQSEIKSTKSQIGQLDEKQTDYRRRLEISPRVEEGYQDLVAERNNVQAKYDDLMKKSMEAKVAQGLEKRQMGERFTLIDPARIPEKPVSPNRPVILFIGLMLGIGSGVGTAALQEASDRSVRNSEDLMAAFPFPVLAEVPEIVTLQDELRKKKRFRIILGATAVSLVAIALAINFFVMDLYVLWVRIARHLP